MVQFLSIIFAVLLQMQAHIFIVSSYVETVGRPNTWYRAKSLNTNSHEFALWWANLAELCFQNGERRNLEFCRK